LASQTVKPEAKTSELANYTEVLHPTGKSVEKQNNQK